MASNFSANQYESEFKPKQLGNWQVPQWYPKFPRRRSGTTKIIVNDRGHLLPEVKRPDASPWGSYVNTWEMPDRMTREEAFSMSAPPVGGSRWKKPSIKEKVQKTEEVPVIKQEIKEEVDIETPDNACLEACPRSSEKLQDCKNCRILKSPLCNFDEKSKLNSPIAITHQGSRSIRHETLERDGDLH